MPSHLAYKFGNFSILPSDKQLLRDGKGVPLAPKVFDTLLVLVESQGRLVEKEEFLKRVWRDSFVQEVALAHAISQLRKVLRSSVNENYIETVPKRGYRFVRPVEVLRPESGGTSSRVTLAVLPFEHLGADAEREYLADGLTEEVIAALGQVDPEDLKVIGRTSMMTYKGMRKPLGEIASELGAAFLVERSIRTEGPRVRITSRLIRASDQIQIWSESYDSEPSSVIAFQRELSIAITHDVKLRLSPERLNGLARRQTRHVEAYDLYLRGRYFWNQLSPQTTRRAVEFYTRATELDPDYALAWSGLADAFAASPINGDACPLQLGPRARAAADHAVGAAPGLAQAQASSGLVKFWLDWDWPAAETAFRKAMALDPSYSLAHRTLGIVLSCMKRHQEAQSAVRTARELDPLDFVHQALSAQIAFFAGDYPSAVEFARQASVLDPEFWVGYYQLAQAYEELGESDLALDALQRAGLFAGGNSKVLSLRGYIFAKLGRRGEAREILKTLEAVSRERYLPPYATALVYAGLGECDAALDWLDRAHDARDVHLTMLTVDPKWGAFRSNIRFLSLVNRCGFNAPGSGGRASTNAT